MSWLETSESRWKSTTIFARSFVAESHNDPKVKRWQARWKYGADTYTCRRDVTDPHYRKIDKFRATIRDFDSVVSFLILSCYHSREFVYDLQSAAVIYKLHT